ncbi:energy-coupling factor ABC transporter ATP-binding protein [Thermosediminibacter oceani]|uniref:ABC transporter ATP-binding protein n=1 Tax=Thermosediminibacter oceani (strain ATCC BAA-1034 / DSM 16646 / JW/IW-1228P) TaxID=555079 RepID=D9S0S4_THEOJ|nr:ATP-binding cassette domain-containing protein [Thermosediminibacter oceani]ADL07088.1 cobalt ABC transporter, ATPase subunit [Thermosediminibacter oceani DSM 16646]
MSNYLLEVQEVYFEYPGGIRALNGVSLAVERGKKVAFLGPNGAGKSTLFLHFNGILRPKKGRILYDGQELVYNRSFLREIRRKVGIVFQDPDAQLFAGTVFQEVSFGPMNLNLPSKDVRERVESALSAMGIRELMDRPVHLLSYGQKKRVSIADVLAMDPEVVVFDEPTAYLDPRHAGELVEMLDGLHAEGRQVILSTHDVDLAYSWADQIFVMKDGRVIGGGSPEEVFMDDELLKRADLKKPLLVEVSDALRQMGLLDGRFPKNARDLLECLREGR